jgi:murein L,D-transpeptidase YafK
MACDNRSEDKVRQLTMKSRGSLAVILWVWIFQTAFSQGSFRAGQMEYPRVRAAYEKKWEELEILLQQKGIHRTTMELYLVAYKQARSLEVWARNGDRDPFLLLKSYRICARSGVVGPKRRQGDRQVPEGFYCITVFNPASAFHLSLGLNYPNASDRILSDPVHPGGDIYIHGSCVTIGCLPLTDDRIRELYILCVEARSNGQSRIPVTIYPARMSETNYRTLAMLYRDDPDRLGLWEDLKQHYDIFGEERVPPHVTFLPDGSHRIQSELISQF